MRSMITQDVIDRFWSNVEKTSGCWLWIGGRSCDDYGQAYNGWQMERAHRVAYRIKYGRRAPPLMHSCDTPLCIRLHSDHVHPGSQRANMRDMASKERQVFQKRPSRAPRGERNGKAVLTNRVVKAIKCRSKAGWSGRRIAQRFRLGQSHVAQILRGEIWIHVKA